MTPNELQHFLTLSYGELDDLNLVHGHAALPLRFGSQIQIFQLPVGERQKVLQFVGRHGLIF